MLTSKEKQQLTDIMLTWKSGYITNDELRLAFDKIDFEVRLDEFDYLLYINSFSISWHTQFLELLGYMYNESQTLNRVTKVKQKEKARQKFKESFERYMEEERDKKYDR